MNLVNKSYEYIKIYVYKFESKYLNHENNDFETSACIIGLHIFELIETETSIS